MEECLSDLSWLPPNRPVVIVHEDLPFGERSDNRQTYLDILRGAVEDGTTINRKLSVVLPDSLRGQFSPAAAAPSRGVGS